MLRFFGSAAGLELVIGTAYSSGSGRVIRAGPRPASHGREVRWQTYSVGVGESRMIFECDFEFPRVIVWDALVDPDLVSGWLAEAEISPEVGGEYNLHWEHRAGQPATPGRITVMQPLERLDVDTADAGRIQFELAELPVGNRGTSTRLRVTLDDAVDIIDAGSAARLKADWLTNLDQLEDLLRGHPVDWANWDRDRHDAWFRHLGEAENSTA